MSARSGKRAFSRKRASLLARWVLPFVITSAALAWVFSRVPFGRVLERTTADALLLLIPALLVFGAVALAIEARCLVRLLPSEHGRFGMWTAARVKAASYPLALIHYAIGAGGLAVLLRRRTGHTIGEATGIVALIALFDVGVQLLMMIAGVTLIGSALPAVRAGVATTTVALIVAGFLVLRSPIGLGPLERIRQLSVLAAARTTPGARLLELGLLRALFALVFLGLIGVSLRAFEIDVPALFLVASVPVLIVVAMIPSVAGLGTGQVAFVEVFRRYAEPEALLACSLVLSTGLILLRASMGLAVAREYTREALSAARGADAGFEQTP